MRPIVSGWALQHLETAPIPDRRSIFADMNRPCSRHLLIHSHVVTILVTSVLAFSLISCTSSETVNDPNQEEWISLFNGHDLEGWIVKIAGHDMNDNFANTFRVADSLLEVRYDGYGNFDNQFGHIFYDRPFSYYRLVVEYRFVGEQQKGGADWARRNSGAMLHSQDPRTMTRAQDFPISVEMQFLGGLSDGNSRPTANVCTPGTEIFIEGEMATNHCINSQSPTFDGDQWVRTEAIVLGDSLIVHLVNGDTVLQYTQTSIGGGVVNGYDPAVKIDGTPLSRGFISLQSESHPIDFRRVELLNLEGCTDPAARNFKTYFLRSNTTACEYRE